MGPEQVGRDGPSSYGVGDPHAGVNVLEVHVEEAGAMRQAHHLQADAEHGEAG